MTTDYIRIEQSLGLNGQIELSGAKNAVLVIMASLILTSGVSRLSNVPRSTDVIQMIKLLESLGAYVSFNEETQTLEIDTTSLNKYSVSPEIMKKMRASILVMGPLLARFQKAEVALPGGCLLGTRPIDFHLKAFARMGASIDIIGDFLSATVSHQIQPARIVLEYPSVGATENIVMAALGAQGVTQIINAALEPEVFDLIAVLQRMGARISIVPPAILEIHGGIPLRPIEHRIMVDRLEAGSLLLAVAITGGSLHLPEADAHVLDVFLAKLEEMGHYITYGPEGKGIWLHATATPKAVSFRTAPYPGFPTDLQAPMMVAQCLASGTSVIQETVFENRLLHVRELQKMGAQITIDGTTAVINGVEELYGTQVIASDIRAACALVLAGLAATGSTTLSGIHHLERGYHHFSQKLGILGAKMGLVTAASESTYRQASTHPWVHNH